MSGYTEKSHWVADANRVSLSMPISKIDKENRLVTGFATLDNVDTSDDIVTAEASKAAFSTFRGNIREMHQPIAAGRLVDFEEQEFFHDGQFYRGIVATAYVSKGAEDTWQKVLDGTLSGFSIGGNITEQVSKFVKEAGTDGKTIRYIEKYDLIELSLVDNPANQLANVFSIVKNTEGTFMKGMMAETTVVNVFWCPTDEIAKNSTQEGESCFECGNAMKQIGWYEEGEDAVVKTANAVATFLRQEGHRPAKAEAISEGGVQMADEIVKSEDVVTSGDATNPDVGNVEEDTKATTARELESEAGSVPTEEEVEAKVEEKEEEKVEDAPTEPDFEKMFDALKGSVNESLEKSHEKIDEAVKAVESHVELVTKSFEEKTSEFEKSLSALSESLESIKTEREGVAKRLDALEKMTAIKKSGEVETEPEKKMQKGLWSGTFFGE